MQGNLSNSPAGGAETSGGLVHLEQAILVGLNIMYNSKVNNVSLPSLDRTGLPSLLQTRPQSGVCLVMILGGGGVEVRSWQIFLVLASSKESRLIMSPSKRKGLTKSHGSQNLTDKPYGLSYALKMSKETMYPKSSFMLMYSRQTGASSNPPKRIFFGLLVQSWLDDSTEGKTLLSLETRIFVSNF